MFQSAAANGLATGAFQNCNWGQIDSLIRRGLNFIYRDSNSIVCL